MHPINVLVDLKLSTWKNTAFSSISRDFRHFEVANIRHCDKKWPNKFIGRYKTVDFEEHNFLLY